MSDGKEVVQADMGASCHPKIHIAIWKFLKQCVPTRLSLFNKRIVNDPLCPRCYQAVEDVNHVLRFCDFAKEVWLALNYDSLGNNDQIDFLEWLSWMFEKYTINRRTKTAITL